MARTNQFAAVELAIELDLGDNDKDTIRIRWSYAEALYEGDGATLDDLREAVTTLEDAARIS